MKLVLAGGGHAHLSTLWQLDVIRKRGHEAVLVTPDRHHYYSGMGPGVLGGLYAPEETRFDVAHLATERGGTVVVDTVKRIDAPANRLLLASGRTLEYDVLSINVGSVVPTVPGAAQDSVFSVKPIERLLQAREAILELLEQGKHIRVAVFGGGPAGCEVAGNVAGLVRKAKGTATITCVAGHSLLHRFSKGVIKRAWQALDEADVQVEEQCHLERFEDKRAFLTNGTTLDFDVAFLAMGAHPAPLIRESGLPIGPDNGMAVDLHLRCTEYPNILGGGDIIHFSPNPLDRVGVYAVRQNPVLFHNILANLENTVLQPFDPGRSDYLLLLNMGDGTAICRWRGISYRGRTAMWLKDYIDRAFMKRFQHM